MNTYDIWIRLNPYQTTHVRMTIDGGFIDAKLLAEAQYGVGNVLNVSLVS